MHPHGRDVPTIEVVAAADARGLIASSLDEGSCDPVLGDVTLRPHQVAAVIRVQRALAELGGALLADEPGLGKSYVALAVARTFDDALLVCPASLRGTWKAAMSAAGCSLRMVSHEALSRGSHGVAAPLVVVDEAHHFRNPATRRYRALAALAADARVLLLTATPVHNGARDLGALLALFRGHTMPDDALLARCIVRRTHGDIAVGTMPSVMATRTLDVADDDIGVVERIAALPPPLPLAGGGEASALVQMTLLRQWASSAAALRRGLDRHLARTDALLAVLESGRLPTRGELASWTMGDDAMQLAFPELMASRDVAPGPSVEAVARHRAAVLELRDVLRRMSADAGRVARLREVLCRHAADRVLCFAQFEETIRMYQRALRDVPGVCALSARGARVAGGPLSRREAVARFAPRANGAPVAGPAEDVRILLATDMLSEGVNLQDASVVVHLDFPWTPARLQQRVGRVARLGSAHDSVVVYAMRMPRAAQRLLAIEARLRAKSAASRGAQAPPDAAERVVRCLAAWRGEWRPRARAALVSVATVRASAPGWLALVGAGTHARLVASVGSARGTAPSLLAEACRLASGADAASRHEDIADALRQLEEWLAHDRAAEAAGLHDAPAPGRRAPLGRIARAGGAPRSHRAALEAVAAAAWRNAAAPMPLAREARLRTAAPGQGVDREWLRSVANLGVRNELSAAGNGGPEPACRPVALIVFGS